MVYSWKNKRAKWRGVPVSKQDVWLPEGICCGSFALGTVSISKIAVVGLERTIILFLVCIGTCGQLARIQTTTSAHWWFHSKTLNVNLINSHFMNPNSKLLTTFFRVSGFTGLTSTWGPQHITLWISALLPLLFFLNGQGRHVSLGQAIPNLTCLKTWTTGPLGSWVNAYGTNGRMNINEFDEFQGPS